MLFEWMGLETMMSSESEFEALRRERLSALIDGELDVPGSADACARWCGDQGVREDWHAWHLIGDVLRSDDLASNASRDLRFLAVVRERLAAEPVLLAPQPGLAAASRQRSAMAAFGHWRLSGAVAAGVVLVVGAFVMTRPPADASAPGLIAAADSSVGGYRVLATPADSGVTTFRVTRGEARPAGVLDREMIRNAHLDRYLEAHKQFAGSSALGVPSAFLSSATVDSATR